MVQEVKPMPTTPASHIRAPTQVSAVLLTLQLLITVSRKTAQDGSGAWVLVTHLGD